MVRRAGRRARDRYKELRRLWLRENRKVFALLVVGGVVFVAAFHLLMAWWPGDQTWASGFMAGAFGGAFLLLRQSPPAVIENWQQGAWGEQFTAEELAKLPAENWTVLNDLANGRFNFDHVVIGRAGIFCLNSKKSSNSLQVAPGGGRLLFTNRFDGSQGYLDDRMLARAKGDAVQLRDRIYERTGQRVWVQPGIVWWGEFPDRRRNHANVGLVHGAELVDWLHRQPSKPMKNADVIVAAIRPGRRRGESSVRAWWGSARKKATRVRVSR